MSPWRRAVRSVPLRRAPSIFRHTSSLERALVATGVSVTLADATQPDQPLVWVNDAFLAATGYDRDEVIGRNCRFLQGPETDPAAVAALRVGIRERQLTKVTLLNYRKDGSQFWNRVRVDPIYDNGGRLTGFVGVQTDVSDEVKASEDRDVALDAILSAETDAATARTLAADAQRRLARLIAITAELATTLDLDELLDRLTAAIVPGLADWTVIALREQGGTVGQVKVRTEEQQADLGRQLQERMVDEVTPRWGLGQVLAGRASFIDQGTRSWGESARSDVISELIAELGMTSTMYVPLLVGRNVIGAAALVSSTPGRHFDADDLDLAAELGRRAGLIVDNARLYGREHRVAELLQHSLLQREPVAKGLEIGTRYLTADRYADVGGDFYEVLTLPDGSIAMAVGDVVGHDLSAAAAMGQLRSVLRTVAWTSAEDDRFDPSEILARVDRLVQHLDVGPYATLFYGRLVPAGTDETWTLEYANAGHPHPLLRLEDGSVQGLDEARGLLLGASDDAVRNRAVVDFPPGATLLAFSDGLVERRREDIETGYARVIARLGAPQPSVEALLDEIVGATGRDRIDDVALLALRRPG